MRKFVCLLVAVAACFSACELKDDTKPEGNGNGEDGEDIPGQLMVSIAGTWVKESYNWDGGSETGDDMDHKVIILREDGTGVWEVDEEDYYADNISADHFIAYVYDKESGILNFHYADSPNEKSSMKVELMGDMLVLHSYEEGHEWWVYRRLK